MHNKRYKPGLDFLLNKFACYWSIKEQDLATTKVLLLFLSLKWSLSGFLAD